MLGALTPLGKVAQGRRLWLASVSSYTVAGGLSSAFVGATLAALGLVAGTHLGGAPEAVAVGALATAVFAREVLGARIPLLELHRATNVRWARRGQPQAAALWGLDIGLFFTTWLTFAGAWWLAAVAALSADLPLAVSLFVTYWLGRVAVVWVGRWLVPSPTITPRLVVVWYRLRRPFQLLHAMTVVAATAIIMLSCSWQ